MIALAWLLIIAVASLLIVRLGTTALTLTGLARETAEFLRRRLHNGITRNDGVHVGVPRSETVCRPLNVLLVYGREPDLQPLLRPTLQPT